jgi:phosphate starvation-inducible protein PhoH
VVTGDVEQADRKQEANGLLDLCTRLESNPVPGMAVFRMTGRDIQRHPIIGSVLRLYED